MHLRSIYASVPTVELLHGFYSKTLNDIPTPLTTWIPTHIKSQSLHPSRCIINGIWYPRSFYPIGLAERQEDCDYWTAISDSNRHQMLGGHLCYRYTNGGYTQSTVVHPVRSSGWVPLAETSILPSPCIFVTNSPCLRTTPVAGSGATSELRSHDPFLTMEVLYRTEL